jgi:hypothetical protein
MGLACASKEVDLAVYTWLPSVQEPHIGKTKRTISSKLFLERNAIAMRIAANDRGTAQTTPRRSIRRQAAIPSPASR